MATNQGKGFAGLSDLVSDVANEVEAASTPEVRPPPKPTPPPTPTPPPPQQQPQAPPPVQVQPAQVVAPSPQPSPNTQPEKSGGFGWVWAVFIGFIVIVAISSNSGTSNGNAPAASTAPNFVAPPAQVATVWQEEKPPVGTGRTFSSNEIRYCKSESIRVDAMQSALNERSSVEIKRFNQIVSDYNSRCADYRYLNGTLEPVVAEVEKNRNRLAGEGRSRIFGWRSESSQRASVQPASQSYSPSSPSAAEIKAAKARERCAERKQQAIDACHRSMPDGAVSLGSLGACTADANRMYRCN